jgi:hypothetical protein
MREFVYLSDRKLRQFIKIKQPWRYSLGKFTGKIAVPPFASVTWEPPAQQIDRARMKQLQKVVKRIKESAEWYMSDTVVPGRWIFFEARLNYLTITDVRALACRATPCT